MEDSRQIYFKNGYILTMNASNQVYAHGSLLVEGDQICAVGTVDEQQVRGDAEIIDQIGRAHV